MNATLNGRPQRKQLSDQLDRLDVLIDCLADQLPKAVADATREGTRQAVREVLAELFGDPETLARLRQALDARAPKPAPDMPAANPVPAATPGVFARLKAAARTAAAVAAAKVKRCVSAVRDGAAQLKTHGEAAVAAIGTVLPLKPFFAVASAVGLAVAVVSYWLPHEVSAVVSGVGGAAIAGGVQLYNWIRRSACSLIRMG